MTLPESLPKNKNKDRTLRDNEKYRQKVWKEKQGELDRMDRKGPKVS